MKVLVTASVEAELSLLKSRLSPGEARSVGGYTLLEGRLGGTVVCLGVVGIGLVSAAVALGCFLTTIRPDQVIVVGSAGAMPGSGLKVGDVAVASSETLSELGLCTGKGIGDAATLGLPGLHQEVSFDQDLAKCLLHEVQGSFRGATGPLLTVAGVSSDPAHADHRAKTFHSIVENMEGYAVALACRMFGVPGGEVRGISNQAGVRDKSRWDLGLANQRAQMVVLNHLIRACENTDSPQR